MLPPYVQNTTHDTVNTNNSHHKVEHRVSGERKQQATSAGLAIRRPALVHAQTEQYALDEDDREPEPCDPVHVGRVTVRADQEARGGVVRRCIAQA